MKVHAFAIEGTPGDKTYCGTPVTSKTVFALRHVYVNCKRCKNKNSGAVTTTSGSGSVMVIGSDFEVYT